MKKSCFYRIAFSFVVFCCLFSSVTAGDVHRKSPQTSGIIENIPNKYRSSYESWKSDLTATEFGENLWRDFASRKNFVLIVSIDARAGKGAYTKDYKWNENGELSGATIVLGAQSNKGFPEPLYYPIMNSIAEFYGKKEIRDETVAASKFAHEFGHVLMTMKSDRTQILTQNELIPSYNSIFLSNGYNINDRRLLDLADRMGGTPNKIWENREYWGETSAMNFLLEKFNKKLFFCDFVNKAENNLFFIKKEYEDRFAEIKLHGEKAGCAD